MDSFFIVFLDRTHVCLGKDSRTLPPYSKEALFNLALNLNEVKDTLNQKQITDIDKDTLIKNIDKDALIEKIASHYSSLELEQAYELLAQGNIDHNEQEAMKTIENDAKRLHEVINTFLALRLTGKSFNALLTCDKIGQFIKNNRSLIKTAALHDVSQRLPVFILVYADTSLNQNCSIISKVIEKAIRNNDTSLVATLFAHNLNPNIMQSDCRPRRTPVFFKIRTVEIAQLFIAHGADISIKGGRPVGYNTVLEHMINDLTYTNNYYYPNDLVALYLACNDGKVSLNSVLHKFFSALPIDGDDWTKRAELLLDAQSNVSLEDKETIVINCAYKAYYKAFKNMSQFFIESDEQLKTMLPYPDAHSDQDIDDDFAWEQNGYVQKVQTETATKTSSLLANMYEHAKNWLSALKKDTHEAETAHHRDFLQAYKENLLAHFEHSFAPLFKKLGSPEQKLILPDLTLENELIRINKKRNKPRVLRFD